ncbi:hypothetical protein HK100_002996 [Physocladia obscura]|uniref:Zn(2)-C6 fungal-type domain-containing protein n=1 Tax=Physocladia obscura TaxID=109957 RepID=A0AAD5SUV0_9FUNG|nr:hypothetical protein HK100_002996 [Physocladia obscura]
MNGSEHPCNRCQRIRKKCDKYITGCARCINANEQCEYSPRTARNTRLGTLTLMPNVTLPPPPIIITKLPPKTFLTQCLDVFECPCMDSGALSTMLSCHLSPSSFMFHSMCPVNPIRFMLSLDDEPSALRLIISAFTAFYQNSPLPIVHDFYQQAEKAILYSEKISTPKDALKYIQTLFVKYQFYFARGQPAAGISALTKAMKLIQDWKLDIDPDVNKNSLLPYEKDERRRIYWVVYYCAKSISLRTNTIKVPPVSKTMQPHSQRFCCSSFPAAICETSKLLQFAGPIIEYARKTPDSLTFLLSSENQDTINKHVANIKNWQKNLPDHLRISPEKLPELLKSGDFSGILDTVILPAILTCMVYRAVLYTTICLPLLYSPIRTATATKFIVSAMEMCLNESQRLGEIFQLLLTMTITENKLDSSFWRGVANIANGCFEAAIVSWFMCRHTPTHFWDAYKETTGLCDKKAREAIKPRMEVFQRSLCLLQTSQCGDKNKFSAFKATNRECFVSPMLHCVNAMVFEIEAFDAALKQAEKDKFR